PEVLVIHLGHGAVVSVAELIFEALDHPALLLQRVGAGDQEIELQQAYSHRAVLGSGATRDPRRPPRLAPRPIPEGKGGALRRIRPPGTSGPGARSAASGERSIHRLDAVELDDVA